MEISDISYMNIKGTSMRKTGVKLACSKSVPCKNIFMQDINLSYKGTNASAYCKNVNGTSQGLMKPSVSCLYYQTS